MQVHAASLIRVEASTRCEEVVDNESTLVMAWYPICSFDLDNDDMRIELLKIWTTFQSSSL